MTGFSKNFEKRLVFWPTSSDFWKAPFCLSERCPSYRKLTVVEFDSCIVMVTSAGMSYQGEAVCISSRERRVRSYLTSRVISQMERLPTGGTEDKYMYLVLNVGKRVCTTSNECFTHSRHVSLSLQFPELTLWYWGSFTQQRGFELSLGGGFLETTYRLTLKEYSDGLLRKPAANWSAAKLRSEVSNVTCHLYGLEEVDGKEEGGDEYAEVETLSVAFMRELYPRC